jgi:hypothetical protein
MFTNKEQSESLVKQGLLKESADLVCFAGKDKEDPYKEWVPVPITDKVKEKMKKAEHLPVWSDSALFNLLPMKISGNELHAVKKVIPGRGLMTCVGYFNPEDGRIVSGHIQTKFTDALVSAVKSFVCGDHDFGEYDYGQ